MSQITDPRQMTATMKAILLSLLVISAPAVFAEGVASMTTVTSANGKSLPYHGLAVSCKSQYGRTSVHLIIRPQIKNPLIGCHVIIYDEGGKKIQVQFDPEIRRAPPLKGLPDGSRIIFEVADEFVDRVQVSYLLHATDLQEHVFRIERGDLREVSALPQ